jgi:hypothetical protein
LENFARIVQGAGLEVSKSQDSDEVAFRKLHNQFNRDALKHLWHQEGSIGRFEIALTELTELLGKGTIQGRTITKPIYHFNPNLENDLNGIKSALSELRAAYFERVNSEEINPAIGAAYFKNAETPIKMNAAKKKVLDAVNKLGDRYSLPPIQMNNT